MLRPNDEIGPYVLVQSLGQGAYGEVWLAERREGLDTRQVALRIPLDPTATPDEIRAEVGVWSQVSAHPNVLPVLDADEHNGILAIATDYVAGGTLRSRIGRNEGRALPVREALALITGVLRGLEHLHAHGVVHGDLKPENVLLQGDLPRVADYGIARVLRTRTGAASTPGTPEYLAPEALHGLPSPQSDLWAAGVILYEMLAGRQPFTSGAGQQAPSLPDSIPASVRDLVTLALQRDPHARYQTAGEMLTALRRCERSEQPIAPPPPPQPAPTPIPTASRPAPWAWIVGGVGVLGLLGIAVVVGIVLWLRGGSGPSAANGSGTQPARFGQRDNGGPAANVPVAPPTGEAPTTNTPSYRPTNTTPPANTAPPAEPPPTVPPASDDDATASAEDLADGDSEIHAAMLELTRQHREWRQGREGADADSLYEDYDYEEDLSEARDLLEEAQGFAAEAAKLPPGSERELLQDALAAQAARIEGFIRAMETEQKVGYSGSRSAWAEQLRSFRRYEAARAALKKVL